MSATVARSWQDQAACAGADPDLFFPEPGADAPQAKKVCAVCPVKESCLEDALRRNEPDAVRGGLTHAERQRLLNPVPAPLPKRAAGVGNTSPRTMAVRHGAYLLTCLVQWGMSIDELAVELGSTPRNVYGAFRILVPAVEGRREKQGESVIERLLRQKSPLLGAMQRRGYTHEQMGEMLGTSQSIVSATLAVLRQREQAVERLSEGGQDGMQQLKDAEAWVRRAAGVGLSVGDVIEMAGPQILSMRGEGKTLRQIAMDFGYCRETVRKAYQQLTEPRSQRLTKNDMREAA